MSSSDPQSIIVLTREHIGDLICTTPALRALRTRYPKAHIAVEVGERAACVLENNPRIDEIIIRPTRQGIAGKARFILLLRRRRFDLGVILDDSSDMVLYLRLGGVPRRVGISRKKRFANLFTECVPFEPDAHEMIDNFGNVVALLGGNVSSTVTEVFPTPDDRATVQAIFAEAGITEDDICIGLNPGASSYGKSWLPERFVELTELLRARPRTRFILFGGPDEAELAETIQAQMSVKPLLLAGRLTILQLSEALRRCDVLVTGDTGPMHLAVAVNTPVVALFGPTNPARSGPEYAPGHRVIRKVDACPGCPTWECQEDRRCMRLITALEVAKMVDEALKEHEPDALVLGVRKWLARRKR